MHNLLCSVIDIQTCSLEHCNLLAKLSVLHAVFNISDQGRRTLGLHQKSRGDYF